MESCNKAPERQEADCKVMEEAERTDLDEAAFDAERQEAECLGWTRTALRKAKTAERNAMVMEDAVARFQAQVEAELMAVVHMESCSKVNIFSTHGIL